MFDPGRFSEVTHSSFTRWRHPYRKCWIKIHISCDTFGVIFGTESI